jgi:hypothetical protein
MTSYTFCMATHEAQTYSGLPSALQMLQYFMPGMKNKQPPQRLLTLYKLGSEAGIGSPPGYLRSSIILYP